MSEMVQPRRGILDRLEDAVEAVEGWAGAHERIVRIAGATARVIWAIIAVGVSLLSNFIILTALGVSAAGSFCGLALVTMLALFALTLGERWRHTPSLVGLAICSAASVTIAPFAAELVAAEASTWVGATDLPDPAVAAVARPLVAIVAVLVCWLAWLAYPRPPERVAVREALPLSMATLAIDHDKERLLRVARHEAAHALVAHRLRLDVEKITTRPRDGAGGYVRYREVVHTSADQTWARCVVAFAGHSVDLEHEHHDVRSNSDIATALGEAINLASIGSQPADYDGSLTVTAIIDAAMARARQILDADAAALGSLAARLVEVREVEFADVSDFGRWLGEEVVR